MNAESLAKVDEKLRKYAEEQASENLDGSPSDTIKDVPPKDKKLPQGKQEEGDQDHKLDPATSYVKVPGEDEPTRSLVDNA